MTFPNFEIVSKDEPPKSTSNSAIHVLTLAALLQMHPATMHHHACTTTTCMHHSPKHTQFLFCTATAFCKVAQLENPGNRTSLLPALSSLSTVQEVVAELEQKKVVSTPYYPSEKEEDGDGHRTPSATSLPLPACQPAIRKGSITLMAKPTLTARYTHKM